MKALSTCLVIFIGSVTALSAGEEFPTAEFVHFKRTDQGIAVESLKHDPLFRDLPPLFHDLIHRVSFSPGETSPKSYIVSGSVVDSNAGAPRERVLIWVGEKSQTPVVVGMTDAFGEFKFRLWIDEDHRKPGLEVKEPLTAMLYVGGGPEQLGEPDKASPNSNFGYILQFKLSDLLASTQKPSKD